jgi:ribosomal protein S19E (S16A)
MYFEIVGEVSEVETIATSRGIRRLKFLRKRYGGRQWRKRKRIASVRLASGSVRRAELHWYEAHGVGRKAWKIKRFLD